MRRFVGGLLLGMGVGVWLGRWMVPERADRAPSFRERASASASRSDAPLHVQGGAEIDRLRDENARLTERAEQLAIEAHGVPIPWPADVAPELRRDFGANLRAAAAACIPEVAVEAVDCAEMPCRGVFRKVPDHFIPSFMDCPEWEEVYGVGIGLSSFVAACGDGRTEEVMVISAPGWVIPQPEGAPEDNLDLRRKVRDAELKAKWTCLPA